MTNLCNKYDTAAYKYTFFSLLGYAVVGLGLIASIMMEEDGSGLANFVAVTLLIALVVVMGLAILLAWCIRRQGVIALVIGMPFMSTLGFGVLFGLINFVLTYISTDVNKDISELGPVALLILGMCASIPPVLIYGAAIAGLLRSKRKIS